MLNLLKKFLSVFLFLTGFFFTLYLHEVQKDIYRSTNKNNEVDVIYVRQVSEDYGFIRTPPYTISSSHIDFSPFFYTKCELCHMCAHSTRKMLNYVRWKWNLSEIFFFVQEKCKRILNDLIFVLPYNQKSGKQRMLSEWEA